ncbi:sla2 Src-like adaptor 2 [Rhizophlyctis rosea]|uniref:Sla2 Src-like adaptor 2 n=1 Tax=Rhizophlyctis rosea TaxID=64517 RepID=A0AAD5SHI5_9FUNG|nr:sla2 Src-like adaptor 2 [Rhizophlyctis rosea]
MSSYDYPGSRRGPPSDYGAAYGTSYPAARSHTTGGGFAPTDKSEEELAVHIKKALSIEETAPKQKHVRACMVYTWDHKGSGSFWQAIKTYPVMGDEVVTFKALITVHKVIRQGHPTVLKDAVHETAWFETLARAVASSSMRGYGVLIRAYVQFILAKLEYHRAHPEFRGDFDYQEYVTLKGIEDPNEGFETINDLLLLLDKVDSLQKLIFANFRHSSNNEARIAALVPLVEESYGIYQFLVNMLMAMHQIIGSVEVLAPLREKFKAGHYALFKFYAECFTLKYLTSLITIPRLSPDPPDFLEKGPPTLPPRGDANSKSQEEIDLFNAEQAAYERRLIDDQNRMEQERLAAQRELELAQERQRQQQMELERQNELQRQQYEIQRAQELQRQQEMELRRAEEERQRLLQMQQAQAQQNAAFENQMIQQRFNELQSQLENLRGQGIRDRDTISQYEMRVKQLESQLSQMSLGNRDMDAAKDDLIRRLQEELAQWKQKYEALAKLYAQLRKEHLDLLNRFKDVKDSANRLTEEARREVEKVRGEMRTKSNEVTELLIERDRLKGEVDRVRHQYEDELARLRREAQDAKDSLLDVSRSKGAEVEAVVKRFDAEREELENIARGKQNQIDDLQRRLESALADVQRVKASQAEDSEVLQAGLDQTLLALAQQQKSAQEAQMEKELLAEQLLKLRGEHIHQLNAMMDNILLSCILTVDEAIYELDSPANLGNQTASPEYVLSLLEKTQAQCIDFGNSFVKLVQTGEHRDAIGSSNSFAHSIAQLLHNAKGVLRLAAEDDQLEEIITTVKKGALGGRLFFDQVKSAALGAIDAAERPGHIVNLSRETQHQLGRMTGVIEKLVPVSKLANVEGDIGDEVERQMRNAAQAIEDAARRLEELMNKPRQGPDLDVHSAILEAAMAITSAIANLIKRATETQQEIVADGRGSTTKGQFYKKNNKWTEGLISAAQAVAAATTMLVETADGLITGTHSYEQLVVAAQEVSVATTQLVAASRVKSVPFSKTQSKLEDAAVAVRKATELLVKAAKEASKRSAESKAEADVGRLSKHQLKVAEMEQKVKILEIEKELSAARYRLGELVKKGYRPDEDE